jgi:hypothetical protein
MRNLWTGFRRGLLGLVLLLLLALMLAAAAVLGPGREAVPRTVPAPAITVEDVDRALHLLKRHDPRGKLPGILRSATLTQRDLVLLGSLGLQRFGEPRLQLALQPGIARLQISLRLPSPALAGWFNLEAVWQDSAGLPSLQRLTLGQLQVPVWLANLALPGLVALLDLRAQSVLAQQWVSHVGFDRQQLTLDYALPDNPQQALAGGLMTPEEQARLKIYTQRLASLSAELATTGPVSLSRLLPPMFALATQRSTDKASAARENRAALTALAILVNDQALPGLVNDIPRPAGARPLSVTLLGRHDTPQHFLVSAVLSARGGGALADVIGLYKEVSDSRGGSGFSFNDLAADRAGTRLGLLAVGDPVAFQARLAAGVLEADLMPQVDDLPESMSALEFRQRFGGVGAPAYRQMMDNIESRLDGIRLLQPKP